MIPRSDNFIRWAAMRRRMIRETERFIDAQLQRTNDPIVIPAIRVGDGEFPRGFADVYWSQILASS